MAPTYSELLTQAVKELLAIIHEMSEKGPNLALIRRMKFIAGFFGIQKISDLGFWLEDWMESGGVKRKPMSEEIRALFCLLTEKVLNSVESPEGFGEFVNAEGIVQRPLFKQEVPVYPLFSRLKDIHPIHFLRRNIIRLSVVGGESFAYSLKLPSRFLEKAGQDNWLSLLYVDLGKSRFSNWASLADLFHQLTSGSLILTQGAMEVPWDFLMNRKSLLPYYILYCHSQNPQEFLEEHGLSGHVMRSLKDPGMPWVNPEGAGEVETEEDFWTDYDLESYDTPEMSEPEPLNLEIKQPYTQSISPQVGFLEEPWEEPERNSESLESSPPEGVSRTGSGLLATASILRDQENSPSVPTFPAAMAVQSRGDEGQDRSALEEPTQNPLVDLKPLTKLTEIPFTLADLEKADFSWPRGLDGLNFAPLPKELNTPGKGGGEDPPEEPGAESTARERPWNGDDLSQVESSLDSETPVWMPETRVPSWEPLDLDTTEELVAQVNGKKKTPLSGVMTVLLVVVLAGAGWMGLWTNNQWESQGLVHAQNKVTLLSALVENHLSSSENAANLFAPSVDGMDPLQVDGGFFELFFPSQSLVKGFGLGTGTEGKLYLSQTADRQRLEPLVAEVLRRSESLAGLTALGETGLSLLRQVDGEGNHRLWLLDFSLGFSALDDGTSYLYLSAKGDKLASGGPLWEKWTDFQLPQAVFLPGTEAGPVLYTDSQGRGVSGAYRRTAGDGILVVLQASETLWQRFLAHPLPW